MASNTLFFAWNRPIPGREPVSAEHFQEFSKYLARLQQKGTIGSFDTVFLDPHGGDLNGFFILRGEASKFDALQGDDEWLAHVTRATLHLQGFGVVRGVTGEEVPKRMELWQKHIPA